MQAIYRTGNIMYGLVVRDLMVRYGRQHLGFIWTVLEPMILCSGVMIVWSATKEPVIHGIPIIAFIVTGYMPLTVSRHFVSGMTGLVRSNFGLLYHSPISHVHILLARLFLEFLSTTFALVLILFVVITTGFVQLPVDPGLALAGWLLASWHFAAVAMLTSVLCDYWKPAEKFVQPWQYLQLPISGVFFMVDWMPSYAQKLLMWNPTVHGYEMFRAGFFSEEIVTHYDIGFLIGTNIAISLVAAILVSNLRKFLEDG